eukprot:scaffold172534_cov37-Prasinocladus_malaysianus.AAC.2
MIAMQQHQQQSYTMSAALPVVHEELLLCCSAISLDAQILSLSVVMIASLLWLAGFRTDAELHNLYCMM